MEQCAECVRLWRAYASATADHLGLEEKLRKITTKEPWESAIRSLTLAVEAAARLREQARDAIRTHEEIGHPKAFIASD